LIVEIFAVLEQIRDSKNLEKYEFALLLGLNANQPDYAIRRAGASSQYSLLSSRKQIKTRIIRQAIRIAGLSNNEVMAELAKIKDR
jgi:hypothetical protein